MRSKRVWLLHRTFSAVAPIKRGWQPKVLFAIVRREYNARGNNASVSEIGRKFHGPGILYLLMWLPRAVSCDTCYRYKIRAAYSFLNLRFFISLFGASALRSISWSTYFSLDADISLALFSLFVRRNYSSALRICIYIYFRDRYVLYNLEKQKYSSCYR